MLKVEGLTKTFGGLVAVEGLNIEVNSGEIVSIIGPNGAGKTTCFNLLTGVYTPSAGSILFNRVNIGNLTMPEIVQLGMSRTFQNIRLFKQMRVIENVLVGGHSTSTYRFIDILTHGKRYKKGELALTQHALDILQDVGLYEKKDAYAGNLSYGEQRRLEIARAMATGAQLLLLDEPAAGMNEQESEDLLNFIRSLRTRGLTVLFIEHDMKVVMNISDRIYVIDHGKQIAHGTPDQIITNKQVIEAYLGKAEDAC